METGGLAGPKKRGGPGGSPLSLLSEFDDAGLTDHRHLDLDRIAELAFDSLCDIAGENLGAAVVDGVRLDDDADLPARLDRERLLDAFERIGDAFQFFEPLDVGGQRFAAGARAGCRDRIAGHCQNRLEAGWLDVHVVGGDCVHQRVWLAESFEEFSADDGVGPLDLMVDRLPDVVQQAGLTGQRHVGADLGRRHSAEEGDLLAVGQDVLSVAGPKRQRPQQIRQFRVQPAHPGLEHRLFAFFPNPVLDIPASFGHHLFDPGRVDPAVDQEMVESHPRHLAADRVEATQDDGLRRVVDDQVDAGRVLERPNVAPLTTDDATLHLVAGDGHHGNRGLRGLLGGNPLHRGHQDVAGALFALLFDDRLAIANLLRDLLVEFLFKVGEDCRPRFGPRHPRNSLELFHLLGEGIVDAFPGPPDLQLFGAHCLVLSVQVFKLAVDRLFLLLDPAFRTLDLRTCVAYLLLKAHADAVSFLFRFEDHLLHLGLGIRQHLFALRVGDKITLAVGVANPEVGDESTHGRTHHDTCDQEQWNGHSYTSLMDF